jgi:hypothetical protein
MITFSLALFLGYTTALLSSKKAQPDTQITPSSTPSATQQNLLVIQLDDANSPQPILQAVWIAAYFKSVNQTVITFTQLYPSNQTNRLSNLDTEFTLKPDGSPSKQFFQLITSANVKWDGHLLIDEAGSFQIDSWLQEQGVPIFTQERPTPQIFVEMICSYLRGKAASTSSSASTFDWNQFDSHFHTDLALDTLLAGWNGLFDDTRPIRCEVVKE